MSLGRNQNLYTRHTLKRWCGPLTPSAKSILQSKPLRLSAGLHSYAGPSCRPRRAAPSTNDDGAAPFTRARGRAPNSRHHHPLLARLITANPQTAPSAPPNANKLARRQQGRPLQQASSRESAAASPANAQLRAGKRRCRSSPSESLSHHRRARGKDEEATRHEQPTHERSCGGVARAELQPDCTCVRCDRDVAEVRSSALARQRPQNGVGPKLAEEHGPGIEKMEGRKLSSTVFWLCPCYSRPGG